MISVYLLLDWKVHFQDTRQYLKISGGKKASSFSSHPNLIQRIFKLKKSVVGRILILQ